MNLIQQLQQSPKWEEFEEWYDNQLYTVSLNGYTTTKYELGFVDLPFSFKKGVFEKFISESNLDITVDGYLSSETYGISGNKFPDYQWFSSFEELLIWYFNN